MADLNEILEAAKHEIAESISDKSAIIKSEHLPTLKVIPFQIQQMFINLLGNSIKYSKANVPPEIHIDYRKISLQQIGQLVLPAKKKIFINLLFRITELVFLKNILKGFLNFSADCITKTK